MSHWRGDTIVEEQISKRGPKNGLRSTPTTQKVWQQIQIAKYPQITYSTFGSTNCGVSDLVHCDFWGGWGVFWSIKMQHFCIGSKLWKNHIFLLHQPNGLVFGQCVLIRKSYNVRCILCFFCVAMVTVYKETQSMGSNVNNNGQNIVSRGVQPARKPKILQFSRICWWSWEQAWSCTKIPWRRIGDGKRSRYWIPASLQNRKEEGGRN